MSPARPRSSKRAAFTCSSTMRGGQFRAKGDHYVVPAIGVASNFAFAALMPARSRPRPRPDASAGQASDRSGAAIPAARPGNRPENDRPRLSVRCRAAIAMSLAVVTILAKRRRLFVLSSSAIPRIARVRLSRVRTTPDAIAHHCRSTLKGGLSSTSPDRRSRRHCRPRQSASGPAGCP